MTTLTLTVTEHPLLDVAVFVTELPAALGELSTPPAIAGLLTAGATAPLATGDDIKTAVRQLLRHGGFKPSGRSKPASEYLVKAVEKGWLTPDRGINLAVDACNAVSLHSGLPVSVLDANRTAGPLAIEVAPPETSYVFNPSGQVIDATGLLVLADGEGPCGSPVKDAQRTKTHDGTRRTISVIWGTTVLAGRTRRALNWYLELLEGAAASSRVLLEPA